MKRCPLILFLVVLVESSSILSSAVPYNALSQNSCVAPVCISKSSYWGRISAFVPKSGVWCSWIWDAKRKSWSFSGRFVWVGGWINGWMYTHTRSMYRLVRFSMLNFLNSGAVCVYSIQFVYFGLHSRELKTQGKSTQKDTGAC